MGRGKHPGGSECGKSIGIERGGEDVGKVAGHEGLEGVMEVHRTGNLVGNRRVIS